MTSAFGEGVGMSLCASSKWAAGVVLLFVAGCAAKAGEPPSRFNPNVAAGGGGSPSEDMLAAAAGSGFDSQGTDNPEKLAPTPTPAGTGGSAGNGGADAGDGCEPGKFCAPNVPDPMDCGHTNLKTNVTKVDKPGNVMVVFDRSGSMEQDWNGMPKYLSAGNALIAALTPLKSLLTVGGLFFPSDSSLMPKDPQCPNGCVLFGPAQCCPAGGAIGSCYVSTIDKADEINFVPGDTFITSLPKQWHVMNANGTPLQTGIERAAAAIKAKNFTDPLIVIVMTDGEPNCNTDQTKVLDQIGAWKTAGINTHVVGLPGAQGAANLLNMMAMTGGTMTYIDPKDPTELEARLRTVISSTVSKGFDTCTFHLDPKADAPEKLHLIVTQNGMESDVPRDLSKDAHWSINAAADEVTLEGQLCDFAKNGTFDAIRFVFGCVTAPPLDPPPPPVLK
jgi:hypothetical protein